MFFPRFLGVENFAKKVMKSRRNNRPVRHVHFSFRPVFCAKWKRNNITRGANQTLILNAVNLLQFKAWISPTRLSVTSCHLRPFIFQWLYRSHCSLNLYVTWFLKCVQKCWNWTKEKNSQSRSPRHREGKFLQCGFLHEMFSRWLKCQNVLEQKWNGYSTQFSMKWGPKFKPDNHDKAN